YGASPRATIYLALGARAHAFLNGRGYVTPQDVKSIGPDVLRHRIIVSYEAEAEAVTSETIIERIFAGLPVPGCRPPVNGIPRLRPHPRDPLGMTSARKPRSKS